MICELVIIIQNLYPTRKCVFTPLIVLSSVFAKSGDPDQMPPNAALSI